jgi:sortase B
MFLSDVVANESMLMAEEKKAEEEKKNQNKKKAMKYRIACAVCVLAAVVCFGYFSYEEYLENQSAREMKELQDMQNMTGYYIEDEDSSEDAVEDTEPVVEEAADEETATPSILPEYQALYDKNPDLVGWLEIEDTDINYPVLQSDSEDDSQYYLTHSFSKKKDKNGSLFMDYRNNIVNRDTNLIIYGHNMKSGAMFGTLKKYLERGYLEKHATIRFDTIYERGTYEVIGAFLSEVSYQDEYTFRYYNFLNAKNETEFEAFRVNVMQLDALDQGTLDAKFGDELLTLSTCNSYTEEGRMFIIAKKTD